jgi:drug/metabolite transporter (DMT)-like permease
MPSLLIGILLAVAASTLYSLGIAVQALDAREVHSEHALRLSLIGQLLQKTRWLAGTGMTILGWPLQIAALRLAPLVVVQPALAAGLLVLLAAGRRILGERVGMRERLAVVAIVLGVVVIALAAPERSTVQAGTTTLVVTLGVLGAFAAMPYVMRALNRQFADATMIGAGAGYAWSGIATKLLSDAAGTGRWLTTLGWAIGAGIASGVAVVSEMSTLQQRAAIQVAPVVFVVQTLVPVALAPILFNENFLASAATAVPMVLGLGVLLGGAVVLARSPLLLALMAPPLEAEELATTASAARRPAAEH